MANRPSRQRTATNIGNWILRDIGRELRVGRILAGKTQAQIGAAIGRHFSHVSRVEHGLIGGLSIVEITRHAAAVGLKPSVRFFPVIARPLDALQLALLGAFRERIGQAWQVALEVPMPRSGDLRAADAVLTVPGCRCVVEIITRLADLQAQARAGRLKVRDLGADRLILVVAANATNRRTIQAALPTVLDSFPVDTKTALRRLAAGTDPEGDAIVLLRMPS